jgi:hypothetical protein
MKVETRYLDGSYLAHNPSWDRDDAEWKASLVAKILNDHHIKPNSVCEVGCGSGDILRCLRSSFPLSKFLGYDVSPQLTQFWVDDQDASGEVNFILGDFHELNVRQHDVLLMLDVFEHVRDPFSFLEKSRSHAQYFVFHIPLDLSASGVARKAPLLDVRRSVGHLNFYTKDLALETLSDCGYRIIDWRYTGASLTMPHRSLKTRLARIPRRIAFAINKDWGVRLFGGETLIVLAQ